MDFPTLQMAKDYTDESLKGAGALKGEPGEPGKDGKAATVQIGEVTTGNTPSVTNSGTETDAVFDFVLPAGGSGGGTALNMPAVTLRADGWADGSQTVDVPGVLADESKQLIIPAPARASKSAYDATGIKYYVPEDGKVTFTAEAAPTEDLTVYVAIFEAGTGSGEATQGPQGDPGTTFTPSVSAEGELSWTNDGGLSNPEPVNIKGPPGEQGPSGQDGAQGPGGKDATINGENVVTIQAGDNVSIAQSGNVLTISAAGGNSGWQEYSTEERRIGTWIDGKPLYRQTKVYTSSLTLSYSSKVLDSNYGSGKTILSKEGSVHLSTSTWVGIYDLVAYANISDNNLYVLLDMQDGDLVLQGVWNASVSVKAYITFIYTKTTDQANPAKVQQIEAMRLSAAATASASVAPASAAEAIDDA